MLSINIYVILISNHSEIYEIYLELISRIVSPSSFCRMFRLYISRKSCDSYETLCCNIYIYIYIYEIQDMRLFLNRWSKNGQSKLRKLLTKKFRGISWNE